MHPRKAPSLTILVRKHLRRGAGIDKEPKSLRVVEIKGVVRYQNNKATTGKSWLCCIKNGQWLVSIDPQDFKFYPLVFAPAGWCIIGGNGLALTVAFIFQTILVYPFAGEVSSNGLGTSC